MFQEITPMMLSKQLIVYLQMVSFYLFVLTEVFSNPVWRLCTEEQLIDCLHADSGT